LGSFQEEGFVFICYMQWGVLQVFENQLIASQPKLPANVFGQSYPEFAPK